MKKFIRTPLGCLTCACLVILIGIAFAYFVHILPGRKLRAQVTGFHLTDGKDSIGHFINYWGKPTDTWYSHGSDSQGLIYIGRQQSQIFAGFENGKLYAWYVYGYVGGVWINGKQIKYDEPTCTPVVSDPITPAEIQQIRKLVTVMKSWYAHREKELGHAIYREPLQYLNRLRFQ